MHDQTILGPDRFAWAVLCNVHPTRKTLCLCGRGRGRNPNAHKDEFRSCGQRSRTSDDCAEELCGQSCKNFLGKRRTADCSMRCQCELLNVCTLIEKVDIGYGWGWVKQGTNQEGRRRGRASKTLASGIVFQSPLPREERDV